MNKNELLTGTQPFAPRNGSLNADEVRLRVIQCDTQCDGLSERAISILGRIITYEEGRWNTDNILGHEVFNAHSTSIIDLYRQHNYLEACKAASVGQKKDEIALPRVGLGWPAHGDGSYKRGTIMRLPWSWAQQCFQSSLATLESPT